MNPDQQSNYWKPDPQEEPVKPSVINEVDQTVDQVNYLDQPADNAPAAPIAWDGDEYLHHEKDGLWFAGFSAIVLIFLAVAIFLIKSVTFTILIVVMAVAVVVLSKRPPRRLRYTLSEKGLYVGDQLHHLSEYKSFGVIRDEGHYSVMLVPVKRFWPGLTVYFPAERGEEIVDFLGNRLPMQELHLDLIDRLVRKLRL